MRLTFSEKESLVVMVSTPNAPDQKNLKSIVQTSITKNSLGPPMRSIARFTGTR